MLVVDLLGAELLGREGVLAARLTQEALDVVRAAEGLALVGDHGRGGEGSQSRLVVVRRAGVEVGADGGMK